MSYLPIFVDLKNRPVLVVGGGHVATRKITALLKVGANVKIVARELDSPLHNLLEEGKVEWFATEFEPEQVNQAYLIIAATDDNKLNNLVFKSAEAAQRLVNVVDDQPHCSYIFPSVIDRSPIQIAISSGGAAPVLIRLLREKLEALIPQNVGEMAAISGRWRNAVKSKFPHITQRRRFWEKLFTNLHFQRLTETHQTSQAEALLEQELEADNPIIGEVSLVGAGPGDAGLLTLKGLQAIQQADVVLYDALVSEGVLELVRRDADRVFVGKRAGKDCVKQEETNALLVKYAKKGKRVVRLKGGDSFVFGRGGEELEVLKAENIPFSVVPGITAALGATAYAGIPLTHREYSQNATFITGHLKPGGTNLKWEALAQSNQTLVVYMGTIKAGELASQLQKYGKPADTPVAIVSNGTLPNQSIQIGTLDELPTLAANAPTPALIIIGEVVKLQTQLTWFGSQAQQFISTQETLWNNQLEQCA
ncbi:Siroheme synthase [Mannheimia sp. USDA-ARS-USMARC-1261]|uniref:siroheme synthase CysG n=1 Tax=Mannheimia sp. USDA-ARS-USMARC-1261 TaxID=1432056 RepID=UPI0003E3AC09|nr:siroheme synthase CysG [Mannheimia sp. USDA-ARS-USMARC-1261]AHG73486.1 Siroheme synthase [Mannheimia sp. USDA-ARS-USMARC-1261]